MFKKLIKRTRLMFNSNSYEEIYPARVGRFSMQAYISLIYLPVICYINLIQDSPESGLIYHILIC